MYPPFVYRVYTAVPIRSYLKHDRDMLMEFIPTQCPPPPPPRLSSFGPYASFLRKANVLASTLPVTIYLNVIHPRVLFSASREAGIMLIADLVCWPTYTYLDPALWGEKIGKIFT